MNIGRGAAIVAAVAAAGATAASSAGRQVETGPVATYWMSASTTTGLAAMGAGMAAGGRRPGVGSMMGMAMGGGMNANAVTETLTLQLGSTRKPQGEPQAEHDPPTGLGVGAVLPLLTPPPAEPAREEAPQAPQQYRQPQGRMLIFWGCGEHAGPGQPLVIDFAKLGAGAGGQQFAALARGMALSPMQPPSASRSATYGEWPNRETRAQLSGDASLIGAHSVKGDYTPQIDFTLAANQDFLPPLRLTQNQKNPSGSASLAWRPVDGALGYFATMFGAQGGEVVMWTSSANQASAFALPEYLSNGDISRLVAAHALMASAQTSCVIPQEAVAAAGHGGFFALTAYGGETNISYPPRPPAPTPWNIAWTVKVRYRSATNGLLGMTMPGGEDQQSDGAAQQGQPPKKKPSRAGSLLHSFTGVIPP
jgi:hypothetical protein